MKPWTDMDALCVALLATESREQALEVVRAAPAALVLVPSLGPLVWGRAGAERSKAIEAICLKPGPVRRRPDTRAEGPLFRRRGGAS